MIDYERLMIAVKEVILEDHWKNYDFETILGAAQICYDGIGIMVKSTDFEIVFDSMTYDPITIDCFDLEE